VLDRHRPPNPWGPDLLGREPESRFGRGQTGEVEPDILVTAVAATGGRGRTTGRDWLIVPALGAGGILTSVRRTSMVKRTNGARGVGGGASLMGVSVSPAVLTLGGLGGGEGKFDLAFLREDDDP